MEPVRYISKSSSFAKEGHIILSLVAFALLYSCAYDDEETLNPMGSCDTVDITYSGVIQPLLASNCYSCHSGSSPTGGIRLDSYEYVSEVAMDGSLSGTVNWEPGYPPMPRNLDQLDSCKLYYINTWIEEGYPDN
jgi:hypothetical protein